MARPPFTVALVTCAQYPALTPDDAPLAAALERRGLTPVPALWDDPGQRWGAHAAVVLRSCWDYHERAGDFARWLDRLESEGAHVLNPVPVLRWNMRKTYLRELAAAGVPVTETVWVDRGSTATLSEVARSTGWTTLVVKPTVSASGWETWLVERAGVPEDERRFAADLRVRDLMIQPFMPSVLTDGEASLVFIAGRYSHAVRKRATPGEFRVQEEHGGTVEPDRPPEAVIAQAARALAAAPGRPAYARADGFLVDGRLVVTELELIEPKLYFRWSEGAADRFAEVIERQVRGEK